MMTVFRFADKTEFYWILVLILIIFMDVFFKKRFLQKLTKQMSDKIYPILTASLSTKKRKWKFYLQAIVVVLMVCTWLKTPDELIAKTFNASSYSAGM